MNSVNTMFDPAHDAHDRLSNPGTWDSTGRSWASGEQQILTCCRVIDETHDVRSFEFRVGDGTPVRFEPGQFMTVSANVDGQSVERCYTISSPPTRPYLLSITVKRVPGGVMSNWLHDNMKPGSQLLAYGPSGSFTPTVAPAAKLLYLSAGSGVTPLMSMTRASIDLGLDLDIVFVHSARTPADIVFRKELQRLQALSPRFRTFFVCEGIGDEAHWPGPIGRLSLPLLTEHVPDYAEREAFTCGPAGYMNAVRDVLRSGGHDPARYHQESFDISAGIAPEPAVPAAAASSETFTVKLSRSSKTFTMNATDTVLSAARKAGVAIPSSCSQGICGTCKTKVLEGTVDMQHNGGIRDREVHKGFRLLCCSRPTSDLVLEL
ncbi:hybrid-cluster NAD(P)-dependent oxidoreductase [Burkholderia vietnamiensis]|uniref:hybrid-cluster NAD(P)-dependent oxidoreductase n=1 Tax=Burkholderia vietnamiensis TaxID=60552 RepID=UPI0008420A32|nr:hybrid-cluster NAD(P)-dependent oxidoreductase [Burkholderia vietnamiensis]AOK02162.1 hybrid-cluster NAD(P)-dependent oxidoreductase [Burkholderia vietnamiensis]HDR8928795.1 hybrid-cluster NAD(P)-dependent oxidoreductase [Burkholderia vietnamiensis]HDR9216855.1 hybrid-cluster NAD(P)-dependent oxidoreductase [Burkholderia vietnamiensis]